MKNTQIWSTAKFYRSSIGVIILIRAAVEYKYQARSRRQKN